MKSRILSNKDIEDLLKALKNDNITETSLYELSININTYLSNVTIDRVRIYRTLKTKESIFIKSGIKIYDYKKRRKEDIHNCINEVIIYIQNHLMKEEISRPEFIKLIKEQTDFKYHIGTNFFRDNDIQNILSKEKIILRAKRTQKQESQKILEEFSRTDIVNEYRHNLKTFTITEIHHYIGRKLSRCTIANYIQHIHELGIPIKSSELLRNSLNLNEEEIIDKVCTYLQKKKIKEILPIEFSKMTGKLKLPYISVKVVFMYESYIYNQFKIKILIKKRDAKNDYKEHLFDNEKQLKKNIKVNIEYMETIPLYTDKIDYCVVNNIDTILEEKWYEFLNIYLHDLALRRTNVRNNLFKNERLYLNTENKKISFLTHDKLHIKSMNIIDIIKFSYIRVRSNDHQYGVNRQSMFIGFLFFLYSQKLMIFSFHILYEKHNFQHNKSELEMFLVHNKVYSLYKRAEKSGRLLQNYLKVKKLFMLVCYSISNNFDVANFNKAFSNKYLFLPRKKYIATINTFYILGAKIDNIVSKHKYVEKYVIYEEMKKYSVLIGIFAKYMNRKVKLKDTKVPAQFYKRTSSILVDFLDFLEEYHPTIEINANTLFSIFDYPDSTLFTYQQYIDSLNHEDSSKFSKLSILCEIFTTTQGYEHVFSKNKIPNYNTTKTSKRNAIDEDEIIFKIDDIVTNRPPKSDYYKNHKVDMDMNWWPHLDRVRPFEPLLIKLHLRIPVRGKTLRLINRDDLLVYDITNKIKGFKFLSDKNKNRVEPFIVPNIWKNELDFLVKLIQFNKEYFPTLQKYYPNDETLKGGITPLFPSADGQQAYLSGQHMLYWTKVLIQTQIEFAEEGKHYNLVSSNELNIPNTLDELDTLTQAQIKSFTKKYDIHSLRHTGITRNIKAGMPLELVRLLSGHSGFNTILTIYYHVNQDELAKNWITKKGIDFTDELNMHEKSSLFIKKEILKDMNAIEPEEIFKVLNNYKFFNQENRVLAEVNKVNLEEISKTEPSFWKGKKYGICTKQQCPDGIIDRCSLCPYFITNYLFIQEISLEMQLSMARVKKYSDLILNNREKNNNHENSTLKQSMHYEIEDFIGWLEILSLSNASYNEFKNNNEKENSLIHTSDYIKEDSIFSLLPSLNIDHGYLEILSQTFRRNKFDNTMIKELINIMANKIIRYTSKIGKFDEISEYSNEDIIRWFLPKYDKIPRNWNNNDKTKKELEDLLKIFETQHKNLRLENKNENTFLTK